MKFVTISFAQLTLLIIVFYNDSSKYLHMEFVFGQDFLKVEPPIEVGNQTNRDTGTVRLKPYQCR